MTPGSPPMLTSEEQQKKDAEHLRLLSIFHFIVAGFALLGIAFLIAHYFVMSAFMNPEFWKSQRTGGPPPKEILTILVWVYAFAGFFLVLGSVLNFLSGLFLRKRQHRLFSLIVAGLNCLHVPLGTALGVFTFIVLSRESVRRIYEET